MTKTPAKRAAPKAATRATKADAPVRKNVSAEYFLKRRLLIAAMAKAGVSTVDIAAKLGVVRSFVIKQRTLRLKPTSPAERTIHKLAQEYEGYFQRNGFKGLLGGEDVESILAGGERPPLGPLAVRREKAEKQAAKAPVKAKTSAKAPVKQPGKPAKPAPKALPKGKTVMATTGKPKERAPFVQPPKKPKAAKLKALPKAKPDADTPLSTSGPAASVPEPGPTPVNAG